MKLAAFLFALLLPLIARADDYEARTFTGPDGAALNYRLLAPKDYDKTKKYPLVIFFHGSGERGSDNAAQLKHGAPLFAKPDVRAKFPCFVFAPQCPADQKWSEVKGWNEPITFSDAPAPAMKLALGAIDSLIQEFSVDTDRLYVTGLSMGGFGTWDLLMRSPERWAAAAPVCGGGDPSHIVGAKGVAVWAFHGMKDAVVPTQRTRDMIQALNAAGVHPLYSEYPYIAHDSWTTAYAEPLLLPWMFAQRRGQAVVPWDKIAGVTDQPPSSLFPGAGTVQSGLWFRSLWKSRRDQWVKDKEKDQGAVVFFGDSITQGWGTLAKDFSNFKVANRGISGDTTRGLRWRVQGDVIELNPKAVSILIGTNDLDQGTEPEVILENLKAIIADLRKANPNLPIIINKVMPRGEKSGFFPDKIKTLNALYEKEFTGKPRIAFCDTWTLFDAGNGQCKKEEFPDMLHPNGAGYAKWLEALKPVFTQLGI